MWLFGVVGSSELHTSGRLTETLWQYTTKSYNRKPHRRLPPQALCQSSTTLDSRSWSRATRHLSASKKRLAQPTSDRLSCAQNLVLRMCMMCVCRFAEIAPRSLISLPRILVRDGCAPHIHTFRSRAAATQTHTHKLNRTHHIQTSI